MMTYQDWIKAVFISFFIASASLIGFNYCVDPMQQYRISSFYPIYFEPIMARYLNAGLAKNYNYNSIVLGTSHTANFIISEVESNLDFNQTIKLCINGGSAKEQSIILQTAIENNKNLERVLWGVDILSFSGSPEREKRGKGSFPMYLYDKEIFNDYKYLYSADTFMHSLEALFYPIIKPKDDPWFKRNYMYQWQHKRKKQFIINRVLRIYKMEEEEYSNRDKKQYSFACLKKSFDENFLDTIRNNPHIHFKIFFPPYSLLHFKVLEENKILDDVTDFKKYLLKQLSVLPNVTLYDFQIADHITSNLHNYKDTAHYHQKISSWMLEEMGQGRYIVSDENIDENIKMFKEQVANYTFDTKIDAAKK
ncbi:MAG: hypothetical protein P8Y50_08600 [Sulfurovaceae bacterium]